MDRGGVSKISFWVHPLCMCQLSMRRDLSDVFWGICPRNSIIVVHEPKKEHKQT